MTTILGKALADRYTLLNPAQSHGFNAFVDKFSKTTKSRVCDGYDVGHMITFMKTKGVSFYLGDSWRSIFERVAVAGVEVLSQMNDSGWDHGKIDGRRSRFAAIRKMQK